jgi:hypothetical protein
MPSDVFSIALCIRLGLFHLLILGVLHCICNQLLDPMRINFFRCAHGGERITLHDIMQDTFTAIMKDVGFHVS